MYNRHPWPLKKSKSWGPFWSYQPNSTANSAHLAHFVGGEAELEMLVSWLLQNGPQDFDFFKGHGCQLFIWAYFQWDLCPQFNGHNNSFLASVISKFQFWPQKDDKIIVHHGKATKIAHGTAQTTTTGMKPRARNSCLCFGHYNSRGQLLNLMTSY